MRKKTLSPLDQFGFGFFCWFVFSNAIFLLILLLMIYMPSINGFPLILGGIWALTILILVILFAKKRIAGANGILVAIILNTLIVGFIFSYSRPTLYPFPSVHAAQLIGNMQTASTPNTASNVSALLK